MQTLHCAICQEKEQLVELYSSTVKVTKVSDKTFSARRTPDRMHYRFVKCQRCGLIFSNPIFDKKEILTLYKKSTFDYPIEAKFLRKTYGAYLDKLVGPKIKKRKLLDIGCGNGFFLEEAMEKGFDVYGIEPGRESVKKAAKSLKGRIKIDYFKKGQFKANSFDVITCFHTLDHLVEPNVFFEEVYKLLKKNGYLIIVVHNTSGLSVRLFGQRSPIFDIEHIYLFNPQTLKKIAAKHKLKHLQTFNVKNTYPLFYWFRMVPMPTFIKKPFLQLLSWTKMSNIPLSMSAGNTALIAQK